MKIKANTQVEVELTEDEQKNIALEYLYKLYNWKKGYYISNENVRQVVTIHGHDAWSDDIHIRYATDDDYVVGGLICKIKNSTGA